MDKVAAPGCAVAWHEEADCGVFDHAAVELGFMAEEVHHVDDTALVDRADVGCDVDVGCQHE